VNLPADRALAETRRPDVVERRRLTSTPRSCCGIPGKAGGFAASASWRLWNRAAGGRFATNLTGTCRRQMAPACPNGEHSAAPNRRQPVIGRRFSSCGEWQSLHFIACSGTGCGTVSGNRRERLVAADAQARLGWSSAGGPHPSGCAEDGDAGEPFRPCAALWNAEISGSVMAVMHCPLAHEAGARS
jgi:hypothetical protein